MKNRHRGVHYYFEAEVLGDGAVVVSMSSKQVTFAQAKITSRQIKEYLLLASLESRRNYLLQLNPFGISSKKSVPLRVLDTDLDAIFLSLNEALLRSGLYRATKEEQFERIGK